jgi:uncharacterized membrane protein
MLSVFGKEIILSNDYQPAAFNAKTVPFIMLGLALLGIADAFYDSYAIYNGQLLWCPPPIDGCNTVANSPYARIFGVPLGYYGLIFYLHMFALAALLAFEPFSRGLHLGTIVYTATGVSFSLYFMYIQFTFIHSFCIYCLVSAALTLLLFIVALAHIRTAGRTEAAGRPSMTMAAL